jgi:hypothetical protein
MIAYSTLGMLTIYFCDKFHTLRDIDSLVIAIEPKRTDTYVTRFLFYTNFSTVPSHVWGHR